MAPKKFFDNVKSWKDVEIEEEGVLTEQFVRASEGLVFLFREYFKSVAFQPVVKDLEGNIKKIQTRYEAAKDRSQTMEKLIEAEVADKETTAREGIMWLLRALEFTAKGLRNNYTNKSEELSVSFTSAYEKTLKRYHNFFVKNIFLMAMKACPYRAKFYDELKGRDPDSKKEEQPSDGEKEEEDKEFDKMLDEYITALEEIVGRLQKFYQDNNYEKF